MAKTGLDLDRAARVLVDAFALGDRTAADRWKISEKTVRRYRARLETDPELSALVLQKKAREEHDWRVSRMRLLRATMARLEALVADAKVEQLRDVAGVLKIVGDLEVATDVLNREQPRPDSTGPWAPPDAAGPDGADDAPPVH
jgi:hypothetical protein